MYVRMDSAVAESALSVHANLKKFRRHKQMPFPARYGLLKMVSNSLHKMVKPLYAWPAMPVRQYQL
jgi:hypothetical protein